MPQPAAPPMTLKEAKRAFKKSNSTGHNHHLTPSQMARADRRDALEERRCALVRKEQKKQDNKRHREEKEEKERNVKQKLLDEGRIMLEDTWGEVSGSQPRLHRFFGIKSAVPVTSGLRKEVEGREENGAIAGRGEEDTRVELQRSSHAKQDKVPNLESHEKTVSPPSKDVLSQGKHHTSSVATAHQDKPTSQRRIMKPSQQLRSPLRALRPSQSSARLNLLPKQVREQDLASPSCTPVPRKHVPGFDDSKRSSPSRIGSRQSSQQTPSSTRSRTISECSPRRATPLPVGPAHDASFVSGEDSPACADQEPLSNILKGPPLPNTSNEDWDDFADDIDDATMLMLCLTQKPAALVTGDTISPREKSLVCDVLKEEKIAIPQPEAEAQQQISKKGSSQRETLSWEQKAQSASFTSVYTDIDDEEFLALEEAVKAGGGTPLSTPVVQSKVESKARPTRLGQSTSTALFSRTSSRPASPTSIMISKPVPAPLPRPVTITTKAKMKPASAYQVPVSPRPIAPKPLVRPMTTPDSGAPNSSSTTKPPPRPQTIWNLPSEAAAPKGMRPPPIPTTKPKKKGRNLPASFFPEIDEFEEFDMGLGTQMLVFERLEQEEAKSRGR